MNKAVFKIKFLSDKSLEFTIIYLDDRLISKEKTDLVYFLPHNRDFLIYSNKTLQKEKDGLRLPNLENYSKNVSSEFYFISENEMYSWLKELHYALYECNLKYTRFVNSPDYNKRLNKPVLSGDYWII